MPSYILGNWQVEPDSGLLTHQQSQQKIRLEAQLMALLHYLVEHRTQVVSRDQLAEHIWPNMVVEDNTISKAITRLRKALQDNPRQPEVIKTVPKRGYQLIAPVNWPASESQVSVQPLSNSRTTWFTPILGGIALLVVTCVVLGMKYWPLLESAAPVYHSQHLTSAQGRESNATVSPDGKAWAAITRTPTRYRLTLFTEQGTHQQHWPVSSAQVMPHWSPSGGQLLFADKNAAGNCQVWLLEVNALLSAKPLVDCPANDWPSPRWQVDGQGFYFASGGQAYHYALAEQQLTPLPLPHVTGVQPSPDGQYLALLISEHNQQQLLVIEPATSKVVRRLPLAHPVEQFIWSADSQSLIYPGQHPSSQLLQHPLQGEPQVLVTSPFGYLEQVTDIGKGGEIIATSSYVDRDVKRWQQGQWHTLVDSAYPDYNPRLAPNSGMLAFASKRNGRVQIWLRYKNGQQRQLSDFSDSHFIYQLAWSPDEQQLLVQTRHQLFYFHLATGQSTPLPLPEGKLRQFGWLSNGQLYMLSDQQLYRYTLANQQQTWLASGIEQVQFAEGHWLLQRTGQGGQIRRVAYNQTEALNSRSQAGELALSLPQELSDARWQYQPWGWYVIDEQQVLSRLLFNANNNQWQPVYQQAGLMFWNLQPLAANSWLVSQTTTNEANIVALLPAE